MEASPLILAHEHAKAASNATQTSDTTTAISEHTAAAGEFARAAETTGSAEALRTLRLLEEHHQRLSELLKVPEEVVKPASTPNVDGAVKSHHAGAEKEAEGTGPTELRSTKNDAILKEHPRRTKASSGSIHIARRMPNREMSSSIASNLASARGIRSGHDRRALSPSVTTRQVPGNLEIPSRQTGQAAHIGIPTPIVGKPSWLPPVTEASKAEAQVSPSKAERMAAPSPSPAEEGFQRWTSTFGNLISKISPALAFTGLPLSTEEAPIIETKVQTGRSNNANTSPTREPDLAKIFSKSALSTLRHQNPGGDSFYLVPPSGHTKTYAEIMRQNEKLKRRDAAMVQSLGDRQSSFDDGENEDFVDARESFAPPSPTMSRTSGKANGKGVKALENMVEELYTENRSLKDCIDQLTKRLHAFEMAAQSSGLAMQESMRFSRPSSPTANRQSSQTPGLNEMGTQIRGLGEQVDAGQEEIQKLGRENEKLRNVISRYRDRWEKLKEGAKTRRNEIGVTSSPKETLEGHVGTGRHGAG